MNKGFSYYFKKAWSLYRFTIKKLSFPKKCLLPIYLVASFVGKLLSITRPIFVVADNNLTQMVKENRTFSFSKCFEGTITKQRYLGLLGSYMVVLAIEIAFALALVLPTYIIFKIMGYNTVSTIVFVAFSAIYLVILYIISLKYSALGFVAQKTTDLDISDYLFDSSKTTNKIRGSLFGSSLFNILIVFALVGVPIIVSIILSRNVGSIPFIIASYAMFVMELVLYFFVFAPLFITVRLAHYLQFEDVAFLKKTIVVKPLPGTEKKLVPLFKDQKDEKVMDTLEEDK